MARLPARRSRPARSPADRSSRRHGRGGRRHRLGPRRGTRQAPTSGGGLFAYVGTYSSPPVDTPPGKVDLPPGNGRGIHIFRVDRATGALTAAGVIEHYTSPSALAFDATGTHVYSTNATDIVDNGTSGTVSAFTVDRTTGQLQLMNSVASGGTGPTYASVHRGGRHLLVANYAGGSVAVLPILPGRPARARDRRQEDHRRRRSETRHACTAGQFRHQRPRHAARAHDPAPIRRAGS